MATPSSIASRDANRIPTLVGVSNVDFTTPVTVAVNPTTGGLEIGGAITANAGTNLNTSALALDTTVSGLEVAQASTTSGQKGILIQGAVTTSAPTYTTAQTSPLSLTTGGLLRVDASGASVPVTGTFWQVTQPVSISGNQAVNVAQINGVAPLMDAGATGTGAQRIVLANDTGKTLVSTAAQATLSGDNTLIAAGTNRLKVYAFSLTLVSTIAVTIKFTNGAAGAVLWQVTIQTPASVTGGANLAVTPPAWLFATSSATALILNLSSAVTVDYSLSYYNEA